MRAKRPAAYTETYDLVVCSGGDGTLDEVVTAMMAREDKVPIGYIPTGTTNDFASSLRIPKNLLDAANIAVNGVPFACDVGAIQQRYFCICSGIWTVSPMFPTRQNRK